MSLAGAVAHMPTIRAWLLKVTVKRAADCLLEAPTAVAGSDAGSSRLASSAQPRHVLHIDVALGPP